MPDKKTEVTVEALLRVDWPNGYQEVRKFDRAWAFAMDIAKTDTPVTIKFIDFVRKD